MRGSSSRKGRPTAHPSGTPPGLEAPDLCWALALCLELHCGAPLSANSEPSPGRRAACRAPLGEAAGLVKAQSCV